MKKFTDGTIECEALRYTGRNLMDVIEFIPGYNIEEDFLINELTIQAYPGTVQVFKGDWILKVDSDNFFALSDLQFGESYREIKSKKE